MTDIAMRERLAFLQQRIDAKNKAYKENKEAKDAS